jgi:hypothetical protein
MKRICLVSAALAILMGCTTAGQAVPTPLAKGNVSPQASSTPSPLIIPSPTMPFVRCDTGDLEMQLTVDGAAAGSVRATIEVRNKSSRDCDLYGYAGIQLLNYFRAALPTKVTWSTSAFFLTTPARAEVVGLPSGTQPLTRDRPVAGHAYIPLSFSDVQGQCSEAALLRVTPPDASTSLVIPGNLVVCSGGALVVNPIRSAVAR